MSLAPNPLEIQTKTEGSRQNRGSNIWSSGTLATEGQSQLGKMYVRTMEGSDIYCSSVGYPGPLHPPQGSDKKTFSTHCLLKF